MMLNKLIPRFDFLKLEADESRTKNIKKPKGVDKKPTICHDEIMFAMSICHCES